MTLPEALCAKYGLTSLKVGGHAFAFMAINDALETAARIADEKRAPEVADEIRNLKWKEDVAAAQGAA